MPQSRKWQLTINNPMVHWCNLELRQFFGYNKPLTSRTAKEAWEFCNVKLRSDPDLTVRGIIRKANVAMIGTTDDPVDSLEWHKKIASDPSIHVRVCPSFRPDKALNITKPGFTNYIGQLAASVGAEKLGSFQSVCNALFERLQFFKELGCRASDHGLDYIPFCPCTLEQADIVFRKAMAGGTLTLEEADGYQTVLFLFLGRAYHQLDIAMKLHYSCLRSVNARMYVQMGPDTGFDMIAQNSCGGSIAALLSALEETNECLKIRSRAKKPGRSTSGHTRSITCADKDRKASYGGRSMTREADDAGISA